MSARRRSALATLGLLLLGGCAAVSPDAGFADLQKIASARLEGKAVSWNRGTAEDKAAQDAVARLLESPLTVDSAVEIALLNNRHLQATYEALGIAQADLVQAGLLENPTFSAGVLFGNGTASPAFSVVQDFLDLLTLSARRGVASSEAERALDEAGDKVLDLAAQVRSAYYKIVAAEQTAELFRQVVLATEAAAELSQRQVTAGNVSHRDQALQQTQYAQATLELSRIEAQIASDRESLNRLLGLWGDQIAWNLPARLPELPAQKPPLEGLEAAAIEHRLDLASARLRLQTAANAVELGRQLRFLSALGLGVTFERDPDTRNWLKGPNVTLTIPIFDQGQARVAKLEAERRQSEQAFVALSVDVRSEVREAWARLSAAQDAAAFYTNTILPLHQQIVEENTRLANGALTGIYDLLRSRQDQINAARDYIGALKEYWVAHSDLERALAGPVPAGAPGALAPARPEEGARR